MDTLHPKENLSDDILMLVNRRDPKGWAYLYEFHPQLSGFAAYRIKNNIDSEDIASEAINKTWLLPGPFDSKQALKSCLYRITANMCSQYRKERGWPAELTDELPESPAIDPAITARRAAKAQEIIEAIRKKKGLARAVGEKILIEGQKNRQVAKDNDVSNEQVARKKNKLIAWIRKKWGS